MPGRPSPPAPDLYNPVTTYTSLDDLGLDNTWLTIGVFDGVHRGHAALLRRLVEGARQAGAMPAVLTFHPHPAAVLKGETVFSYLTPPEEKNALLAGLGAEAVISLTFDRTLAGQSAETFMRRLSRALGLRHLLIGYDFALGRGREGDAALLTDLGKGLGYTVERVQPIADPDGILSSTSIRQHLQAGRVAEAAAQLGRWYSVSGPVVHGDGRGRKIDLPTANLAPPPEKVLPVDGVYACWAWIDGEKHAAVTNIGTRPTFSPESSRPTVETHLLDFSGDLYGQELRLEFAARLREERKFPGVDALVAQIRADIEQAASLLT
jgi:riboflavin kinase/FMN adenylyltransferase